MSDFGSIELEAAILRSLSQKTSDRVDVRGIEVEELRGGFDSPRVRRLDVRYVLGNAEPELTERFVQKYASSTEREVMRLLEPLADEHPLPRLIGSGNDEFGSWILMLYIPGELQQEFILPSEIIRTLAHLHRRFRNASEELASLPQLDLAYFASSLATIEQAIEKRRFETERCRVVLQEGVATLRDAANIVTTAQGLPKTLLHGDVHPGNIIHRAGDGLAVLFDWGNAHVGPAGSDLTNCIPSRDLPEWREYWQVSERLSGIPVSAEQQAAHFHLGRVTSCVQYLPFAVEHLPEYRAESMLADALDDARALQ